MQTRTRCAPRRSRRRARATPAAALPVRPAAPGSCLSRAACWSDNAPQSRRIVPAPEISPSCSAPLALVGALARTPPQQAAAALRQAHRAAALALSPMDGPGLQAGKLAALGAERAGVARLIGIGAGPALPCAHERHPTILADRSLPGLHADARRA